MKKTTQLALILLLCLSVSLYVILREVRPANKEIRYLYCLDGDSAVFELNGEELEVRLLAIDCPEKTESLGKEATDFSKKILSEAQEIELIEDKKAGDKDKYDRHLFWVMADGELLQLKLVENGLAKIDFIYDDYLYLKELQAAERSAKENKLGIWSLE